MEQTAKDQIGILKSIWRKNEAGVWTGHDLKVIDLKPRKGFSKDYFKIENEVNLMAQMPGRDPNRGRTTDMQKNQNAPAIVILMVRGSIGCST